MLNKKFVLFCLLYVPTFASSSAWLVNKGKIKIIPQLEFKKFHEVSKNYNKYYSRAEINYLTINLEYGISNSKNLLGEIKFSNLHSYRFTTEYNKMYYMTSKDSNRFFAMPNSLDSISVGIKSKVFQKKTYLMSNDFNIIFSPYEGLSLAYKMAFGKNLLIAKKDIFLQSQYTFKINPIYYNYDQKIEISMGYKKSLKKMYILSCESYIQKNYYDKFIGGKANLYKSFYETRIQMTSARKINEKVTFQKSVFTTINRSKTFASSGINIGLWINL